MRKMTLILAVLATTIYGCNSPTPVEASEAAQSSTHKVEEVEKSTSNMVEVPKGSNAYMDVDLPLSEGPSGTAKPKASSACGKKAMRDWVQAYAFASTHEWTLTVKEIATARNKACLFGDYAEAVNLIGNILFGLQDQSDIGREYAETTAALYRLSIALSHEAGDLEQAYKP